MSESKKKAVVGSLLRVIDKGFYDDDDVRVGDVVRVTKTILHGDNKEIIRESVVLRNNKTTVLPAFTHNLAGNLNGTHKRFEWL
jgi:hypothetical protein